MQDIETRKLTRAKNAFFNERKVVGFSNQPTEGENDFFFDVAFDDENDIDDNENIVAIEKNDEVVEEKNKLEVDGENTSSCESENQIEISRRITVSPKVQAPPIFSKKPDGSSPPRLSRNLVLQERSQKASVVQQTPQIVKPKTKVPSNLDMAEQLVKIGLPSNTDKCIERWWGYRDMQESRRKARKVKREERSRYPPQKYGQKYRRDSTFFLKEAITHKQAISSSEKLTGCRQCKMS